MPAKKYFLDEPGRLLIQEKYDSSPKTIDELMNHFSKRGIPRYQIKKWAVELGVARRKEPRWTTEEESYLECNLHRRRLDEIARHLGRTRIAVELKAKRLGARKTQEGYTMRGLMLGFGMTNHHRVLYWIEKRWIKATRRKSERTDTQGGDIWYFSDKAIRDLIRNHPEEIDPRRADWLWLVDVMLGGDYGGIGSLDPF